MTMSSAFYGSFICTGLTAGRTRRGVKTKGLTGRADVKLHVSYCLALVSQHFRIHLAPFQFAKV